MSKERARARAAREAARAAEPAQPPRRPVHAPRRAARRPPRYGAMPLRTRLGLAGGVLLVQFVGWQVLYGTAARLGLLLVSLAALPVVVTLFVPRLRSRS